MALRVLLADNSESIRRVMQLGLQDFGVQLKTVQMGPDVMASALEFKPDIIFVDVLLQKKSGYEVAHELKTSAEFGSIPIVLMWSGFMEFSEEKAKATGAEGRLEKPFDSEILRNVTKDLVPRLKQHALSSFLSSPFISKPDLTKTSVSDGSKAVPPRATPPAAAATPAPKSTAAVTPNPKQALPVVPVAPKVPAATPVSVPKAPVSTTPIPAAPVVAKPVAVAPKAPRPLAELSKSPRPIATPVTGPKPVPSAAQAVKAFASQAPTPATSSPTTTSQEVKAGTWSMDDFPAPPVPGIDPDGSQEPFTSQPLAPLEPHEGDQPVAIELDAPWPQEPSANANPDEPDEEWQKKELSDFTVNVPLDQLSGEVDVKINPNIDADVEFKTSVQQRFGNTGPGANSVAAPSRSTNEASPKKVHPQVEKEMRARQVRETPGPIAGATAGATPTSRSAGLGISEEEVHKLIQTQTETLIKEIVQQIVPELATRLIQAEIERLLSERGPE